MVVIGDDETNDCEETGLMGLWTHVDIVCCWSFSYAAYSQSCQRRIIHSPTHKHPYYNYLQTHASGLPTGLLGSHFQTQNNATNN